MNTIVKLAPGNIGWFDPLTSIHLTLSKTEAIVKPGMNTTNIKEGLSQGRIILKQGTLHTSRQITSESADIEIKAKERNIVTTSSNKSNIDTIKQTEDIVIDKEATKEATKETKKEKTETKTKTKSTKTNNKKKKTNK